VKGVLFSTRVLLCGVLLAILAPSPALQAQGEIDAAMKFFADGGAYCFRAAPEGVSLSEETEWTILMLTGTANATNTCRVRAMEKGATKLDGDALKSIGLVVTGLWRRDGLRDEFFDRFAAAIGTRQLRARVVRMSPPGLATMKPMARAEAYLKFADRGTRVDFSKVEDIASDAFLAFRSYLPD
jgi:hypothetical protein